MSGVDPEPILSALLAAVGRDWVLRALAGWDDEEPIWMFSKAGLEQHPFLFISGPEAIDAYRAIRSAGESDE